MSFVATLYAENEKPGEECIVRVMTYNACRGGTDLLQTGLSGAGDFMAPERHFKEKPTKPLEICNTLQGYSWGYDRRDEGRHRMPNRVIKMLGDAKAMPANLLLNTGPLPDGSVHPEDVKTLKEVGRRSRG